MEPLESPPAWFNPVSIAILALAAARILWAVARWAYKTDQAVKDVPKEIKAVNRKVGTVEKKIVAVEKKFAIVQEQIGELLALFPRKYVASHSPVRLTKLGEQAAVELGIHAWATNVAPDLLDRARGKEEFEVYKLCSDYVQALGDDDMTKRAVDAYAYEQGSSSGSILAVLMVVLRDRLLELLKEDG